MPNRKIIGVFETKLFQKVYINSDMNILKLGVMFIMFKLLHWRFSKQNLVPTIVAIVYIYGNADYFLLLLYLVNFDLKNTKCPGAGWVLGLSPLGVGIGIVVPHIAFTRHAGSRRNRPAI